MRFSQIPDYSQNLFSAWAKLFSCSSLSLFADLRSKTAQNAVTHCETRIFSYSRRAVNYYQQYIYMAISSAARSLSICVSRSNIRDWRIRRIIYFSPISRIRGKITMPWQVFIMQLSCGEVDTAIMQEAGADGMPHTDIEPVRKKKISSRTRSRNRTEEGQEGIPGYPHKESAHHHPYNPPRKRYSPPLLLFSSLSKNFFLTKNSCSIIPYTEVRYDK